MRGRRAAMYGQPPFAPSNSSEPSAADDLAGALDQAPVLIWISSVDKGGVYFNQTWLRFTGRSLNEEAGTGWLTGVHPADLPALAARTEAPIPKAFRSEIRLRRKDGAWRWMLTTGTPRSAAGGAFAGYIGACIDVTEYKETPQQERSASLDQHRLLLEELNHRVKNYLQATISILRVQARRSANDAVQKEFERACERIWAIGDLHAHFSLEGGADRRIDFSAYLKNLCNKLRKSVLDESAIAIECRVGRCMLDLERAVPLGLIVNELVINATKHAFPEGGPGGISLVLEHSANSGVTLSISDTGVGLPADKAGRQGLGMRLVEALRRQAGATIQVINGPGLCYVITVPAS